MLNATESRWENISPGTRQIWASVPALAPNSLREFLGLAEPQFSFCKMEIMIASRARTRHFINLVI